VVVNHDDCQVRSHSSEVRGHIEETHEKFAIELDIADNQCCTSLSYKLGKAEAR
jgi:hypothetical protein